MLSADEAKELISQFKMPVDDVHLVTMNDYQFVQKEKSIREMRDKLSYLADSEKGEK